MKLLFWALLIAVALAFLGLFLNLLAGLRRRRGGADPSALLAVQYRAVSPLNGWQTEALRQAQERWPGQLVLCDVPYARFLVADSERIAEGTAPLLVCDEVLRPSTVVAGTEDAVPEAALAEAGVSVWRLDHSSPE
ncbi:hypothetical protein [Endothiovibrio diazotrophicus]